MARWVPYTSTPSRHPETEMIYSGYNYEEIASLTSEALAAGFNHFKMKVGADRADDFRRGRLIRSIIDDLRYLPPSARPHHPQQVVEGKECWSDRFSLDDRCQPGVGRTQSRRIRHRPSPGRVYCSRFPSTMMNALHLTSGSLKS